MWLWLTMIASPAWGADIGELPELSAPIPLTGSSAREEGQALRGPPKGTASIQAGNAMAVLGPIFIVGAGLSVVSSLNRGNGSPLYVGGPLAVAGVVFMLTGVPLSLEGNRQHLRARGRPPGRPNTGAVIGAVYGMSLLSLALSPAAPRYTHGMLLASGGLYVAATVSSLAWSEDNRHSLRPRPTAWIDPVQQQGGLGIQGRW
ncbi:MAG: hypothetical protein AB8H79_20125 [Myxococcota bacterium]